MTQLRRHSLLESCLNTASGFLVSYLAWPIVCRWVLHVPFHTDSGLEVVSFFTVLSVARNYLWRRTFDRRPPQPEDIRLSLHRHSSPSMDCPCTEPDAYNCAAMRYRRQLNRYWHPQRCVCPCHEKRRQRVQRPWEDCQ